MSVDLTMVPWNRLKKLAPPNTSLEDLQEAADRWALRADMYAAAADLWEDAAMAVDITNDCAPDNTKTGNVQSVSQDGISVTYSTDPLAGNGLSARVASRSQMLATARRLRAKAKPSSPLVHDSAYNPWTHQDTDPIGNAQDGYTEGWTPTEQIIVVDEV